MANYSSKQGDSLWIDITCKLIEDIDPVFTNWMASWNLVNELGAQVMSGNSYDATSMFIAENNTFALRLGPLTTPGWATMPLGNYVLTIQIDNSVVDYRKEEQHVIVITKQGLQ